MRNYLPQPGPLGNRYDRTRQYHNASGPGPAAGLYTTNPNGSQAIRRRQPAQNFIPIPANMQPKKPVHNYLAGMPGDAPQVQYTVDRQDAQGNFTPAYGSPFPVNPNAIPAAPMPTYGTPEVHPYGAMVNLSAQQNHQARQARVAAGNGRGQNLQIPQAAPTPSFMHQVAEMDRQYQQQMAAANGSPAYQQGLYGASEIPQLANMYRQTALNRYRNGSTGGANMIERAQQLSKSMLAPDAIMPGGINAQVQAESSARNFQAQRDYLSDPGYQNSQALLARNHTGDGTAGVNGLYTMQRQDGKYALTSRANAAQGVRAAEVGPLTGRGGKMFVDIHGNETSENDPNGFAINARTNPSYRENAARNQARIQANREDQGGISDRDQRQLGHLERSLNRAVAGGKMTAFQAERRLKKEQGLISRPKNFLDFSDGDITSNEFASTRLPTGQFPTAQRNEATEYLNRVSNPQNEADSQTGDRLRGLGIDPAAMTATSVLNLMPQGQSHIPSLDPEVRSKRIQNAKVREMLLGMAPEELRGYGKSLAMAIRANMAASSTGEWEREGVNLWNDADDANVKDIIAGAAELNLKSDLDIDRWISSVLYGEREAGLVTMPPKTYTRKRSQAPLKIGGFDLMTR